MTAQEIVELIITGTAGGETTVELPGQFPSEVLLEVEDDGPGLSPGMIERIFEPLVTAKAAGTGLGLVLCRVIIDAHGGEISAGASQTGGASFRMWLPITSEAACCGNI